MSSPSVWTYLSGVLSLSLTVGALGLTAFEVRRRILPHWSGSPARLAEVVVACSVFFVTCELLGVLGLLRTFALVATFVVLAGASWVSCRTRSTDAKPVHVATPKAPRWSVVLAFSSVGIVIWQWCTRVVPATRDGAGGLDAMVYHLPFAARFAQEGRVGPLHFTLPGFGTQFVPATAELVHSGGMIFFHRDFLSPFANLGWVALLLLAAHAAGRPWGAGPLLVAAACAIVALPLMVTTQAGTGLVDIAPLALTGAAVALMMQPDGRARWGIAAAAVGLTIGTKATMLIPFGVATVGMAWHWWRTHQSRRAAVWVSTVALTGGFWYIRNLVLVGNPTPWTTPSLLGVRLRGPELINTGSQSVLHYAFKLDVWREFFVPAFNDAFGRGWPLLLLLSAVGIVSGLLGRDRRLRGLSIVAILNLAVWLSAPVSAGGPEGSPVLFVANLRWMTPALLIGLFLLPMVSSARNQKYWAGFGVLVVVVLLGGLVDPGPGFVAYGPESHASAALIALMLISVAYVGARISRERPRLALMLTVPAMAAVVLGLYALERRAVEHRYAAKTTALAPLYVWAESVTNARIAVSGFAQVYPLYGLDLSNHVQVIADETDDGGFRAITSCASWRAAVNAGRYDYVVTGPLGGTATPVEESWVRNDLAAQEVIRSGPVAVFAVHGRLDESGCRS